MKSKCICAIAILFGCVLAASAQKFTITPTSNGLAVVKYTNAWFDGVGTLQGRLGRKWVSLDNFYTVQQIGQVILPLPPGYSQYRLRSMSVVPGNAFSRLALAYGNITTVGGTGPTPTGTNLWRPEYEGEFATNVPFSTPRAAVADAEGNIYVVETETHAVLVIRTNGRIYTAIGQLDQRAPGNIDIPVGSPSFPAVNAPPTEENPFSFPVLNRPTGLYYSQGLLYVLDSGNGRVLKYTNGSVGKLFAEAGFGISNSLANGGSLWVSSDEQDAFYTDGTVLKRWEAKNADLGGFGGAVIAAAGFVELADVTVNSQNGDPVVVDRGANLVYRVRSTGVFQEDVIAGTGLPRGRKVGPVQGQSIYGPSSIAPLPIGGYLLALDQGARVIYVDKENEAATLIFGKPGVHTGDGQWFRRGGVRPKISNVQSVNVAPNGDIILLEGGFVRKIEFLRSKP